MSLLHSYTLLAPLYDAIVAHATNDMRRASLKELDDALARSDTPEVTALLPGFGTGLDLDGLPRQAHCIGLDLTPAMLTRAHARYRTWREDPHTPPATPLRLDLVRGDAMALPCRDASVDVVILHLILAVVSQPLAVLREAQRVVRPGGQIIVLDKFLRPGQRAPLRRLMNMFLRHVATRTDVVFEPLLAACPELVLIANRPASARSDWFRRITLHRTGAPAPAVNP